MSENFDNQNANEIGNDLALDEDNRKEELLIDPPSPTNIVYGPSRNRDNMIRERYVYDPLMFNNTNNNGLGTGINNVPPLISGLERITNNVVSSNNNNNNNSINNSNIGIRRNIGVYNNSSSMMNGSGNFNNTIIQENLSNIIAQSVRALHDASSNVIEDFQLDNNGKKINK